MQTRAVSCGIPHPWPRDGFPAGTGAGERKFTRGYPVSITTQKGMYYGH